MTNERKINMKKKLLIGGALLTLAFLCLALLVLADGAAAGRTQALSYPEGGLSDSIFVSQNGTYQKSDYLPVTRELSGIPFLVDLPRGTSATVGGAVIVKASQDLFAFVSEHDPSEGAAEVILREFPKAVMSDYDERFTYAEEKVSEEGYLNGHEVRYSFSRLVIANEAGAVTSHYAAYDVVRPGEGTQESVLIAFVTTGQDDKSLKSAKAWLDATLRTLRRDEKLEKRRASEKKAADGAASGQLKAGSYDSLLEDGDEDARFVPFTVERACENLCVRVSAARPVTGSSITLYSPEGRILARAAETGGDATWLLYGGRAAAGGTYVLKVTKYSEFEELCVGYADAGGGDEY